MQQCADFFLSGILDFQTENQKVISESILILWFLFMIAKAANVYDSSLNWMPMAVREDTKSPSQTLSMVLSMMKVS